MRHLTPTETHTFLHQHPDAVFIDCRSTIEYYFVGHPIGAIHVAWNDGEDWEVNPHFAAEIWRQVDRDPQPFHLTADTAVEDVPHPQLRRDLSYIGVAVAVGQGRVPRDHEQ